MVCNRFSDQELLFELIFLLFRQSFISVAGCFIKPSRWMGKGLGAVYSPQEEETAPNGLPLDLSIFNEVATFASTWGDKRLNVLKPKMVPVLCMYTFSWIMQGKPGKMYYLCNQNTTALMTWRIKTIKQHTKLFAVLWALVSLAGIAVEFFAFIYDNGKESKNKGRSKENHRANIVGFGKRITWQSWCSRV